MTRSARRLLAALVVVAASAAAPPATAQQTASVTVVRAVDGDTIETRADDGTVATVRLIGIDTPESVKPGAPVECGGPEAAAATEGLVGRRVTLTADPTQDRTDRFGRVLAYVDLDGVDAGLALVRAGLAEVFVFDGRPFARFGAYEDAEAAASRERRGAHGACGGDFHRARTAATADATPDRAQTAEAFVRRHYARLGARDFRRVWGMYTSRLRGRLGSYAGWRAGYRTTRGIRVNSLDAGLADGRAVVRTAFRARDRDACSGRTVAQFFRSRWVLVRAGGQWRAASVSTRKVGGGRVRTSRAACAPKPKPARQPQRAANPGSGCSASYSPCVPDDRDYDCGELSNGPYRVIGPDDQRLDADRDGVGCEG